VKLSAGLRKLIPWLTSVSLLAILLRHFDFSSVSAELRRSDWIRIAAAMLMNLLLLTICRTERFSKLIEKLPRQSREKAGMKELTSILMASRALNLVLPARAGETLRTVQLHRRYGYPMESVIAAIAMETTLEATALGITAIALVSLWKLPQGFEKIVYPLIAACALCISLFLFARAGDKSEALQSDSVARPGSFSVQRLIRRLRVAGFRARHSARVMTGSRVWLQALGWTWLGDLVDLLMIGLCLHAVGISLGVPAWFLLLAGINVAIALPSPGHLGTLEAGAVLTLSALGIEKGPALTFALVYHAVHLLPVILLGSASLHWALRRAPV
jgi:uncharacterized protein (TIRG00374 family)